jgi:5-formyltetrahydrofolate cyclo-ligase
MSDSIARWQGRSPDKDALRQQVWTQLENQQANIGPVRSHIPNFIGAEQAAERLAGLPIWTRAAVVKSNPDAAQSPLRLRALQDGKRLYMPIPELKENLPFVLLDPAELARRGIAFEEVAGHRGAVQHGRKVRFDEMEPLDLVVTGCVAVTRRGGRTGKGAGFADIELGIMGALGLVRPQTPVLTTVHPLQVFDDERLVMLGHDWPLDWIITPDEVIETHTPYPRPAGILWDKVQPDQFRDIPFLASLRDSLG